MSRGNRTTGARCAVIILFSIVAAGAAVPGVAYPADPPPSGARDWRLIDVPPASPGGLRAEASGETTAWVKWSPSDDDDLVTAYEVFRGGAVVSRGRGTSFSDTGLAAGTSYCYGVRAVDASGRASLLTDRACVTTPDLTPPEMPPAPGVTLVDPTTVNVTWPSVTDNVGVVGYDVQRAGRSLASGPDRQFHEGGLRAAKTYCYAVRAVDHAGNWSALSPATCVTPPDVTPPTPPRPVAFGLPRAMTIDWPPSSDDVGVTGYEVLQGEEVVATTRTVAAVRPGLAAGRHCFSVRAFDAAGNRSPATEACGVVPDTTPPTRPVVAEAVAPGETSVSLRWSPSQDDVGVVGYEVVRDDVVVARVTDTQSVEEHLRPYVAYCYRVRAFDAAGNRSDPSEPSCVMTPDLTPPLAPSLASATPLSDRSLRLAWLASTDNVGVAGYEVLRDGAVVGRSAEPAFELRELQPGRDYCLEIRAFDAAGLRSTPSEKACAHTPDLTPPTIPGGLLAAATSASRVSLGWSPSEDDVGVAGYEVWRGDVLVSRGVVASAFEAGLAPSAEYCYRIRAYDAAGNVSDGSAPVCTRTGEPGTPSSPVELEAMPAGARAVALRWKPSPDPGVVYAVFWDGSKRIGSTRHDTYRVEGLKPGQRRCFQVAAVDAAGNSSPKTWPVCATAPAAPSASAN